MKSTVKKNPAARIITAMFAAVILALTFSFSTSAVSASAAPLYTETEQTVEITVTPLAETEESVSGLFFEAAPLGALGGIQVVPLAGGNNGNNGGGNAGGTNADAAYTTIITWFIVWFRRVGMLVALVGAIMFALAIKNNDADQKQAGLVTLVAGVVVAAICQAADMFDLFT